MGQVSDICPHTRTRSPEPIITSHRHYYVLSGHPDLADDVAACRSSIKWSVVVRTMDLCRCGSTLFCFVIHVYVCVSVISCFLLCYLLIGTHVFVDVSRFRWIFSRFMCRSVIYFHYQKSSKYIHDRLYPPGCFGIISPKTKDRIPRTESPCTQQLTPSNLIRGRRPIPYETGKMPSISCWSC